MRLIQVGVGGFGQSWLGRVQRDRAASLVAVTDVNAEALAAAQQRTGLAPTRCFDDFRTAFANVEADAVLNATPPDVHHEVALAAFEHGLHVLTEKPLADSMHHAQTMVAVAEAAGKTLMVSQNYRFRPWARTMRELVQSGEFGPPDIISVRFAKALRFDGSFRFQMAHPLIRDMSIHHFDLMRALTGREPVSVYARTWKPPWSWFEDDPCAAAIFELEGGLKVVYEGTWVTRGRETTWDGYWSIECPGAVIELRADRVHVIPAEHPDEDALVEMPQEVRSGQSAVLVEFQRAVAEGTEPETSGRDNLKSMAMSLAAMDSSRTGQVVRIADILNA